MSDELASAQAESDGLRAEVDRLSREVARYQRADAQRRVSEYRRSFEGQADGSSGLPWLGTALRFGAGEVGTGEPDAGQIDTGQIYTGQPDTRQRVVVVLPDGGLGDAPTLGLTLIRELQASSHVVAVLLADGDLVGPIAQVAGTTIVLDASRGLTATDAAAVASEIAEEFSPRYAVAVSLACHRLGKALEIAGVPVVALVLEHAAEVGFQPEIAEFFATVARVVFPSPTLAAAMAEEYLTVLARTHTLAVPGPVAVPRWIGDRPARQGRTGANLIGMDLPEITCGILLAGLEPGEILIVGVGPIQPTKGVEYFLEAAGRVGRTPGERRVRFAWIGERSPAHAAYHRDLFHQWRRLPEDVRVDFVALPGDLAALFGRADLMFLSSRVDGFPNAAIAAACHGLPVVCFEVASGFSEWAAGVSELVDCVVPYLDGASAAEVMLDLVADDERRTAVGRAGFRAGAATFVTSRFATEIDALGRAAAHAHDREVGELAILLDSGQFDPHHYGGSGTTPPIEAAQHYLRRVRAAAPLSRPRSGVLLRRPAPGFNPLAYAESAPGFIDDGRDPFAHYLQAGRPKGRWAKRLILPQSADRVYLRGLTTTGAAAGSATAPTVLVHGHFHYPELLPDFLDLLDGNDLNALDVTLALTASTEQALEALERLASAHPRGEGAALLLVPNRGRNLSALLTGPVSSMVRDHDLVLHVHGKRSPHLTAQASDLWRRRLWTHLVGFDTPLAEQVVAEFAGHPRLGLVAPEDPHLNDWDLNGSFVQQWLSRLGMDMPIPAHFDFPLGAMFWARSDALAPLLDADLGPEDFPAEPLAADGTSLHALERLIAFVVESGGYEFAKTYLPSVRR